MPKPVFLIEGQMEQIIIRKICRDLPAVRIGVNGKNVELATIAKFCAARIRILRGKHWPFIVIFDRERRQESAHEVATTTIAHIHRELPDEDVRVIVADRTIENWIMFDHEILAKKFKVDMPRRRVDGGHKTDLERILYPRAYHETTLGVDMFVACRPTKLRGSPSFLRLIESITFECAWMRR